MKQAEYDEKIMKVFALLDEARFFAQELASTEIEIEPEPKATGWAKEDETYALAINPEGTIGHLALLPRNKQGLLGVFHDIANKFTDDEAGRAKAEEIDAAQLCYRLLKRFSDENGGEGIDWGDKWQPKFFIYNQAGTGLTPWSVTQNKAFFTVYFITEEICQQAIEKYRPQIMAAMGV